jgi:hypothetical protein
MEILLSSRPSNQGKNLLLLNFSSMITSQALPM